MARIRNHSLLNSQDFAPPFCAQRYVAVDDGGSGDKEKQTDNRRQYNESKIGGQYRLNGKNRCIIGKIRTEM